MYIIGDVHGKIPAYNQLIAGLDYSLQLGDMSFRYDQIQAGPNHKFFGGNHDNYDIIHFAPNYIGKRFGTVKLDKEVFIVEGAFSIDIAYRLLEYSKNQIKSWWPQEELSFEEMNKCLKLYKRVKPDIVVTHTCPTSIEQLIGNPRTLQQYGLDNFTSKTNELLQCMLDVHRPSVWVFGHFHTSWNKSIGGTEFRCLNELEAFKL